MTTSTTGNVSGWIQAAATQYGLNAGQLTTLFNSESGLNQAAVNQSSGASGIAQILPSTAQLLSKQSGVSANSYLTNAQTNISGGAQVFAEMLQKYGGNVYNAVLGYKGYSATAIANGTVLPSQSDMATIVAMGGTLPPDQAAIYNQAPATTQQTATSDSNSPTGNFLTDPVSYIKSAGWMILVVAIGLIMLYFGLSGLVKGNGND